MRIPYSKRLDCQQFGDFRLTLRFQRICGLFEQGLSQSIPQVCLKKSQAKAVYRFLGNEQVSPQKMINLHGCELAASLSNGHCRRLLQISDTVELDFTKKKGAARLGSLNYVHQRGMLLHNSLLFTDSGLPMSLLWQSYTVRGDAGFGESEQRLGLPIEQKESYRWLEHFEKGQALCQSHPGLEVVYVADSEADIMELFQKRTQAGMHLVVRSKHDRLLADRSQHLYTAVSAQESQGRYQIKVTDPHTQQERAVTLEVRFCPVQLAQHRKVRSKPDRSTVQLYVVQAKEVDPPEDIAHPVEWVLLTTLPVAFLEQALQVIGYYVLRWLIERFHYLLKSGGARVEELQLETAARLQNAVTAYSIATLKALKIRYWAEKAPLSNIYEAGITPVEHEVLYTYAHKAIDASIVFEQEKPPTIAHYCRVLGQIGGFFPSNRQELQGLRSLRGLWKN